MTFLIINELYECGGAEEIARSEFALLKSSGIDAHLLTFDPKQQLKNGAWTNYPLGESGVYKLLSRSLPWGHLQSKTLSFLDEIRPDIIHLHNLVNGFAEVFAAIKRYRQTCESSGRKVVVFQTLHDYGCVCPRSWCTYLDGAPCSGFENNDCSSRCKLGYGDKVRLFLLGLTNRRRLGLFDFFVTPSDALTQLANRNGFNAVTVSNPFEPPSYRLSPVNKSSHDFLYFGRIGNRKGVFHLLDAWPFFVRLHPEANLSFVGVVEEDIRVDFFSKIDSMTSVNYEGSLIHEDMLDRIRRAHCVVVPSIWMENSPNTVREALCLGTLAAGSNRGGIPEMIRDARFLFDPFDSESIVRSLEYAFSLSENEYSIVVSSMRDSLIVQSNPDSYIDTLLNLCKKCN